MDALDISDTIIAKSDQLNADDLVSGPIIVKVTDVRKSTEDQPVIVHIDGGHRPWKPCKTMRRVLVAAWSANGAAWIGRSLELYRDDSVKWGGEPVGGIRISRMSDIPKPLNVSLAMSKGKKSMHRIDILKAPTAPPRQPAPQQQPPVNVLDGFLTACRDRLGLDPEAVRAWASATGLDLAAMGRPDLNALYDGLKPGGGRRASYDEFNSAPAADLTDAERAAIVAAEAESTTPPENI